jgi:small conductance mechanosensitive channel
MSFFLFHKLQIALFGPVTKQEHLLQLLDDWGDDAFDFLRTKVPKIVGILIVAFILIRLLSMVSRRLSDLSNRQGLPSAVRAQQLRTLASVIYSVGAFVILFLATMQVLSQVNINVGPLLASAGLVGLAVGFGAQTLVKDFINGFFILVENQYDIGDTIRVANVQGVVEAMTLRRTVLRADDGTQHTVPNSQITIVSNLTRDWAQLTMHVSVFYGADSDRVVQLLKEVANEVAADPRFAADIIGKPEVLGIEKISGAEVDYLLLMKTKPGAQYSISRELRSKIKGAFEKNHIEPGNPNRVYLMDAPK